MADIMKNPICTLATLLVTSPAFADYQSEVLADNPLAYYRFEEAVGATTLTDSSGNALDIDFSIPTGTTAIGVTGAIGNGIQFNGDGFVISPLTFDPSAGDFTIELLFKGPVTPGVEGVIVANKDGDFGTGRSNIIHGGDGTVRSFSGGGSTFSSFETSEEEFVHVVLSYDKSAADEGVGDTFRFYTNGVASGVSAVIVESANGNWVVGSNKNEISQFFTGVVDEVAIYDTRLDDPNGDGDIADSRVLDHYKEYLADTITVASFESEVPYLDSGTSAELSWLVSPALTSLTIDDGSGPVDALPDTVDYQGGLTVSPTATTTYTLAGTGPLGSESLEVTIVVDEPAVIDTFTSSAESVAQGTFVELTWQVTNGAMVEIDNGVGVVDSQAGAVQVAMIEDTTFTLTATNSLGSVTSQVDVTVEQGLEPTLVAHWRVGETGGEVDGTTLISETGESFAGTFVGTPTFDTEDAAPVPGGSSASIVFDGANSYVDILGYNGIGGAAGRTVAFWFKGPAQQTNRFGTMVAWGTNATTNRFDTRIESEANPAIRTEVSGSGSIGTVAMADDTWHHCAVVLDPAIGTTVGDLLFYIDGELDILSNAGPTAINTTTTVNVRLGASQGIGGRSVTGKMDDIRIYDGPLSAEGVAKLFNAVDIPLQVTAITRRDDGNAELTWSGSPGIYALDYSLDLEEGSWIEIEDEAEILDGETSATIIEGLIAPAQSKVFYRFRVSG
jgi:hypothetical protein